MVPPEATQDRQNMGSCYEIQKGKILEMEAGFLGETTNNVAELMGSLRGLQATMERGHRNVVLEGDSQVVIHLVTRILHGREPYKISPS